MRRNVGSHFIANGKCEFTVWAPLAASVNVKVVSKGNKIVPLQKNDFDYWTGLVTDIQPGDLYVYNLGAEEWPDPASQHQPQGVHGPSQIVDHSNLKWQDPEWKGLAMKDMIIYELHVGTFTPEGTFEAIIPRLDHLSDLGINAIELMPIAQFPGTRNWGYDGVYPFAVQQSYGGPEGLKKLVNACHQNGIAVIVDAVYNHFGPEGSYHEKFGPYHTDKYSTPWGSAINFDDANCDGVRNYFIQNSCMWFRDYHIDALRLDAIHACKDLSALHFFKELSQEVKELEKETGRKHILIGECDLNDPKYIDTYPDGGYGLDAQWCDEFHHALRSLVTGDTDGYYEDFGTIEHLRRAYQDTFVYTGRYSKHRKRTFGAYPEKNPYSQFVVFFQNHDQIGNRLLGDRISTLVSFEALKVMAASVLLSPSVPMLFMGEEFGEDSPFQYFVSHSDEALINGIREGRKKEFSYFNFQGEAPDPQSEETFNKSKINWNFKSDTRKTILFNFYKTLIRIRKTRAEFQNHERNSLRVLMDENHGILKLIRDSDFNENAKMYIVFNYKSTDATFIVHDGTGWRLFLDSADESWGGTGKSAPEYASMGDVISIKGLSVIIFSKE